MRYLDLHIHEMGDGNYVLLGDLPQKVTARLKKPKSGQEVWLYWEGRAKRPFKSTKPQIGKYWTVDGGKWWIDGYGKIPKGQEPTAWRELLY